MLDIEKVTDIEVLRQVARLQQQTIEHLQKRLAEMKRELAKLQGKSDAQLQLEIKLLEEQLNRMRQQMYGASSERSDRDNTAAEKKKSPQSGHGPRPQPQLPVVERTHELDEADKVCPKCGGQLVEWEGQFEESEEIDYVQCEYRIVRHKRKKYRCQCQSCIETALGPPKLILGGRYSIDFAAHAATAKYGDVLPLSRQVGMMKRRGLVTDEQTLFDQIYALLNHLRPSLAAIEKYVLAAEVVYADETRWPVLGKGKTKQWWAWSAACEDAVIYKTHPERSTEAAKNLLGDYSGIVMCDGYSVYGSLKKELPGQFTLAHCFAHARRKFVEAQPNYPEAEKALELIGGLYCAEHQARNWLREFLIQKYDGDSPRVLTAEEKNLFYQYRLYLRQFWSKRLLAQLWEYLHDLHPLPKSLLGKACGYALDYRQGLTRFVDDARIEIDNNLVEREMRPVALGRKNYYGSRSKRGTEMAAAFYSLIETAKLCGVDPEYYLSQAARRAIENPGTATLPHDLLSR